MVAVAAAWDNYETAAYEHKCPPGSTDPECVQCREAINSAYWKIKVANENSKVGYIPDKEAEDLKKVVEELKSKCP